MVQYIREAREADSQKVHQTSNVGIHRKACEERKAPLYVEGGLPIQATEGRRSPYYRGFGIQQRMWPPMSYQKGIQT